MLLRLGKWDTQKLHGNDINMDSGEADCTISLKSLSNGGSYFLTYILCMYVCMHACIYVYTHACMLFLHICMCLSIAPEWLNSIHTWYLHV
jgi:hypothetical protein